MTDDLVKRLRGQAEYVASEAADRIEQLEAALQRLSKLDEFLNGEPSCVEEVMNYTQSIARAALAGEKNDD